MDGGLWNCRDNACVVRKPRENTNYQTSAARGQGTPCPYINPTHLTSHLTSLYSPLGTKISELARLCDHKVAALRENLYLDAIPL